MSPPPSSLPPEIVGKSPLHEGWCKLFRVLIRIDGGEVIREVEDHGRAVAVLPYDPVRRTALLIKLRLWHVLLQRLWGSLPFMALVILEHGPDVLCWHMDMTRAAMAAEEEERRLLEEEAVAATVVRRHIRTSGVGATAAASFLSLGGATAARIAVRLSVTICVGDVSTLASTNANHQRELAVAAVKERGRGQVAVEEGEEGSIRRIVLSTS